jgi:hypothetical protein
MRAFTGKTGSDGHADALGSAGNDGDAVFYSIHLRSPACEENQVDVG